MPEAFYYWPYTLVAKMPLNARSKRREFPGVLLRQGAGFACLHPWPELGDHDLSAQMAWLKEGGSTPLLAASLRCLRLDASARHAGLSLFDGRIIPPSQATLATANLAALHSAKEQGFRLAKVKADGRRLEELADLVRETPIPIRIDCNETGDTRSLSQWLASLSATAREHIDFLEDPSPYNPAHWQELQRRGAPRLAADRASGEAVDGCELLVVKPARQDPDHLFRRARSLAKSVVVTSYMDHPIGQAYAALFAASAGDLLDKAAGLMTHHLFERNAFSERLGDGAAFLPPSGYGLGFDDLLEALPWRRL